MAANTATTVFSDTPLVGVDVGAKSSTPAFKLGTNFLGSDGYRYFYIKANATITSVATIKLPTTFIVVSTDSGSAGFTMNFPSGAVAGQYGWCRKTSL